MIFGLVVHLIKARCRTRIWVAPLHVNVTVQGKEKRACKLMSVLDLLNCFRDVHVTL